MKELQTVLGATPYGKAVDRRRRYAPPRIHRQGGHLQQSRSGLLQRSFSSPKNLTLILRRIYRAQEVADTPMFQQSN